MKTFLVVQLCSCAVGDVIASETKQSHHLNYIQ